MAITGNGPNDVAASFGPFSIFFFFFYSFFISNLTSTYRLYRYIKGWRGSDGMVITGNGPNDATVLFGPFS